MIHLTKRALEFLTGNRVPEGGYKSEVGKPACDEELVGLNGWCRTEDVKAMVRKTAKAWIWHQGRGEYVAHEVNHPNCPNCCVLLDAALAKCPEDPFQILIGVLALFLLDIPPKVRNEKRLVKWMQWEMDNV